MTIRARMTQMIVHSMVGDKASKQIRGWQEFYQSKSGCHLSEVAMETDISYQLASTVTSV
jgi:hypothetical protein